MDFKSLLSALFVLSSMARLNLAAESIDIASKVGKITEGYVLDLVPSRSLYTNGLFECAITCHKRFPCYYFNYQSALERSGICEVFREYLSTKDIHRLLLPKPGFVFVQTELLLRSCLDFRSGSSKSGTYHIFDEKSKLIYEVYCDFTTEPGMVWTLVSSRRSNQLLSIPFFTNYAIDEENPNWVNYRLSLGRMEALQKLSTHWRVTCNLPTDGVDYRDYVRAKFSEVDIVHLNGKGLCKQVEYVNIRGYNCSLCMTPWWQISSHLFHTDSWNFKICGAMSISGSVNSEDNFGYYGQKNAAFRCTKDPDSTTNWWFGGHA
ncbi:uncharacterized protein LOC116306650 [Actinia tenebrosa]|uniref:Uncharacterized protein LOC116306650 n=1 Tax=Actinia tenebrosa TaxID=6105 RepID=A0A6P8IZG1_ACTTE|nr:uncharacterized protein LOC116306650 [Actinia tenebrosa]